MSALKEFFKQLVKDYGDDVVRRARDIVGLDAEPAQVQKAVQRIAPKPVRKALPAPPKPLALPAPKGRKSPAQEGYTVVDRGDRAPQPSQRFRVHGPDGEPILARSSAADEEEAWYLADLAVNPPSKFKPKGGQWVPETPQMLGLGYRAPEAVAQDVLTSGTPDADPALRDWWTRAATKYLKTDFGTENDPLRDLAERNLLHIPDVNADLWTRLASATISEDPIGYFTVPPHAGTPNQFGAEPSTRAELLQAAPWLIKQPVTDSLYGLAGWSANNLELPHVLDEMQNAMRPDAGFPADLAVRPESLQRMSFPQAVERVGRINQWRQAQQAEADLVKANNPAVHTYKEYPENNPRGLRWAEIKAPTFSSLSELPEGVVKVSEGVYRDPLGHGQSLQKHLEEALRYEGDTMGHCVGGYCDDVISGRSRIFSLRDARGEPHVTVETAPGVLDDLFNRVPEEVQRQIDVDLGGTLNYGRDFNRAMAAWAEANLTVPSNIIQIKGKGNRAPVDEYLPFVQDFVKSGTWGNVGDFGNTGLVKLPDGRYITKAQLDEVATSPASLDLFGEQKQAQQNLAAWNLNTFSDKDWEDTKHLFDGFALGGRVDAERCFSRNPLAVR